MSDTQPTPKPLTAEEDNYPQARPLRDDELERLRVHAGHAKTDWNNRVILDLLATVDAERDSLRFIRDENFALRSHVMDFRKAAKEVEKAIDREAWQDGRSIASAMSELSEAERQPDTPPAEHYRFLHRFAQERAAKMEKLLDASRAESAALRAALAEAERYGAPIAAVKALSFVKNPCKKHNEYWTTSSGSCMACRAVEAEQSRDALAAELDAARKALRTVHIELAALVADPENPDWRLFHPEIREPDAKCLADAYNAARTAASTPANDAARELDAGGGAGPAPSAPPPASKEGE